MGLNEFHMFVIAPYKFNKSLYYSFYSPGQILLHDTMDQLRLLVECFQLEEEARNDVMNDDVSVSIPACIRVLAQCCNMLMEVMIGLRLKKIFILM